MQIYSIPREEASENASSTSYPQRKYTFRWPPSGNVYGCRKPDKNTIYSSYKTLCMHKTLLQRMYGENKIQCHGIFLSVWRAYSYCTDVSYLISFQKSIIQPELIWSVGAASSGVDPARWRLENVHHQRQRRGKYNTSLHHCLRSLLCLVVVKFPSHLSN